MSQYEKGEELQREKKTSSHFSLFPSTFCWQYTIQQSEMSFLIELNLKQSHLHCHDEWLAAVECMNFSIWAMNRVVPLSANNGLCKHFGKTKKNMIPCRALWGSWAQLSMSLISLITGNSLHSASMTSPQFQWADSCSCSLGKGGM